MTTDPSSSSPATKKLTAEEVAIEDQARALRAALDDQLEQVRSLSFEDQLELSVDEQLAQFLLITSQYPDEALKRAVLRTNHHREHGGSHAAGGIGTSSDTQRLPLHLACDTNAPLEIIRWLLDQDPGCSSLVHKDKWGDLPLHTACSRKDVEVVRLLVERDTTKETILTKDNHGALPIHMACR